MNSLYTTVAVLAAIASIGSTGAILQQQGSAIIVHWKEEFRQLTDEFEKAVSDAADTEPPDPDRIQSLVDDYKTNLTKIFENEPRTRGDPPGEVDPPDPDTEPPDPELNHQQPDKS
jgi:hypothetical protein